MCNQQPLGRAREAAAQSQRQGQNRRMAYNGSRPCAGSGRPGTPKVEVAGYGVGVGVDVGGGVAVMRVLAHLR